jgi:hypothetical protein
MNFLGKWPQIQNGTMNISLSFLTTTCIPLDKGESNKSTPNCERRRVTQSKEEMSKTPNKR